MNRNNVWSFFQTFQSVNFTQEYLKSCYMDDPSPEKLSYKNCFPFIYFLQHGEKYFKQAEAAPYELQPILLFYGAIQLMKATILTVDPSYPASTQVLAHGVTTRKRKKTDYTFLHDEVKVQRNGLFTHFSEKVFHMKHLEGNKYKIKDLLYKVPEIHFLFQYTKHKVNKYKLHGKADTYSVSTTILDDLHLSKQSFLELLKQFYNVEEIDSRNNSSHSIQLKFNKQLCLTKASPILFNHFDQTLYLPSKRSDYFYFPEILTHYLILYNLSMICRYETEWWGDLFHQYTSIDLPFIKEFLEITKHKVPYYTSLILSDKLDIK